MADEIMNSTSSRRDVLKKAAVVGAAAWSVPLVSSSTVFASNGGATPKCATEPKMCFAFNPNAAGGNFNMFAMYLLQSTCACEGTGLSQPGCVKIPPTITFENVDTGVQLFASPDANGMFTLSDLTGGSWVSLQQVVGVAVCPDRTGRPIASVCSYTLRLNATPGPGFLGVNMNGTQKSCTTLLGNDGTAECVGAQQNVNFPDCAGSITL